MCFCVGDSMLLQGIGSAPNTDVKSVGSLFVPTRTVRKQHAPVKQHASNRQSTVCRIAGVQRSQYANDVLAPQLPDVITQSPEPRIAVKTKPGMLLHVCGQIHNYKRVLIAC